MVLPLAIAAGLLAGAGVGTLRATDQPEPELRVGKPELVSPATVERLGRHRPLYWAGPPRGTRLEVTRGARGRFWVRYLTGGAGAGDRRARYLTVGSYPMPNAHGAALRAAGNKGTRSTHLLQNGGIAVWSKTTPTNVYVAAPGSRTLVEVYSPSPSAAHRLALSGAIERAR